MPNLLIVYASTHGHTAKIAERIAGVLRADGADETLAHVGDGPDTAGYDAVVVGASIHAGSISARSSTGPRVIAPASRTV